MKTKLPKILGVALTLMLVISLFAFAVPVAAAPGDMQWAAQAVPTTGDGFGNVVLNGATLADFAVAGDGTTIYAVNNAVNMNAAAAPFALYKSVDGGQSFSGIPLNGVTGTLAAPLGNVAVAPDNPDAVAISTRDATAGGGINDTVFVSNNGGVSWSALPLPTPVATQANVGIQDLAVGPVRAGTLLSREYLIAVADDAAGVAEANLEIIGGTAAWTRCGPAAGLAATYDFMACAFSPNFVADRVVTAVGATVAVGIGSTYVLVNSASNAFVHAVVALDAAVEDFAAVANGILAADIALPVDFDPTVAAGQRGYACTASATAANDGVYRIDATVPRELGLVGTTIKSVAYSGTIDAGTLLVGQYATTTVKYTANPTTAAPTWITSKKSPFGPAAAPGSTVRIAPDFATSQAVFAITSGVEGGFSLSADAGVAFSQEALINQGAANIGAIDDIVLSSDGTTLFMTTDDGADLSLWKTATPVNPFSWSRVYVVTAAGPGIVRLSPDYLTDATLTFADTAAGGALAGVNNVFVSFNGGDTYSIRSSPVGATAIGDIALENSTTLYVAQGANIYKSTLSGWTYGAAVAGNAGAIVALDVPLADNVLVGGTNACSYSTNGGAVYTKIAVGLAAATYQICADDDYASNNTIYAGGNNVANNNIYRFVIGTDAAWAGLANAPAAAGNIVGIARINGALYGMGGVAAAGCNRTLNSHDPAGMVAWTYMTVGAPAATSFTIASDNTPYAAVGITLFAYNDYLATLKPEWNMGSDSIEVGIDPVTGRAYGVDLVWNAMGSGTGLVNNYDFLYYDKAQGVTAAAFDLNNAMGFPTAPKFNTQINGAWNLRANTEYVVWVRAGNEVSADNIVSPFSAGFTIKVQSGTQVVQPHAGPILLGPQGGATDVSLTPGFSWAPISGATEYEFTLATDSALANAIEGTPVTLTQPSWQVPAGTLEYSTTYFWGVKAIAPTSSPLSIGTFATMAEPVEPLPPVVIEPTPPPAQIAPAYIWGIIGIGAILVIVVIALIIRTRRTM